MFLVLLSFVRGSVIYYNSLIIIMADTQIEKAEYIKIRKLSIEKENPGTEISDEVEQDMEREVSVSS